MSEKSQIDEARLAQAMQLVAGHRYISTGMWRR
jgi:hypothetical protein